MAVLFPPAMNESFCCSISLTAFGVFIVPDFGHSNRYVVIPCLFGFLKINLFIYFLAVLGLRCCVPPFSSCGEWGLLFVAVRGLLIAVASLCCRAQALGVRALQCRLSSCGARA